MLTSYGAFIPALVAVDRDGVLVGFLGSPDNHLVRCAVDGYTCTGATDGWFVRADNLEYVVDGLIVCTMDGI